MKSRGLFLPILAPFLIISLLTNSAESCILHSDICEFRGKRISSLNCKHKNLSFHFFTGMEGWVEGGEMNLYCVYTFTFKGSGFW